MNKENTLFGIVGLLLGLIIGFMFANNVNQKKKKLWTSNAGGERIFYYQSTGADGEGRCVAWKIEEHLRRNRPS